jgi:hypothetical protein
MPVIGGETTEGLDAFCESTLYRTPLIALRGQRYKYIMELLQDGMGKGELYDWQADPLEKRDLTAELPDKAFELRSRLIRTYSDLSIAAGGMSEPQPVDLDPKRIDQLRSLGYIR